MSSPLKDRDVNVGIDVPANTDKMMDVTESPTFEAPADNENVASSAVGEDNTAAPEGVTVSTAVDSTKSPVGDGVQSPALTGDDDDIVLTSAVGRINVTELTGDDGDSTSTASPKNDFSPGIINATGDSPISAIPADTNDETTVNKDHDTSVIKVVSYHKEADTYVKVRDSTTGQTLYYKVHWDLVSAASDALSTKFKKRTLKLVKNPKGYRYTVDMVDDGVSAIGLDLAFSIIHYKFHQLPERPSVDNLHAFAQVLEKYHLAHLVVPWAEKWLVAGLNWHVVMAGAQNDDDKTLVLCWILGEARFFTKMLAKAARNATIDDEGNLLDSKGQLWSHQSIPVELIAFMMQFQQNCLAKLISAFDKPVTQLLHEGLEKTYQYCRSREASNEVKESCQLQQLGSLMSGLTAARLLPFPKPSTYKGSVSEIIKKLESVRVVRYKVPGVSPHNDSHINCGIESKAVIREVLLADACPISKKLIGELQRRGEMSGVYKEENLDELKSSAVTDGNDDSETLSADDFAQNAVCFKQVFYEVADEQDSSQHIKKEEAPEGSSDA